MGEPIRTCIGCRAKRFQSELIRIGRTKDGMVAVGLGMPGRGAYVCPTPKCVGRALASGALKRALRLRAPLDENVRKTLIDVVGEERI
jgi:predicted RNA-binding protein YlxR (DUF448 family)